jgi:hypothetical protein
MKKEFVTYEQALALKELGFDEPCILLYRGLDTQPVCQMGYGLETEKNSDYNDETNYWLTVPTYSQAFRWFREKYNFEYQIIKSANGNYSVVIHLNTQEYLDKISTQPHACIEEVTDCYSYEEAELECLIKLIEIIKNK